MSASCIRPGCARRFSNNTRGALDRQRGVIGFERRVIYQRGAPGYARGQLPRRYQAADCALALADQPSGFRFANAEGSRSRSLIHQSMECNARCNQQEKCSAAIAAKTNCEPCSVVSMAQAALQAPIVNSTAHKGGPNQHDTPLSNGWLRRLRLDWTGPVLTS